MKGIIFNLVEEVVADRYGEDVWDQLIEAAGVAGVYTSLGSYPDDELFAIVGATSSALALPPDAVVRTLGEASMPLRVQRYRSFFEGHTSTRSFLLTLNDIIHTEVRKLYPGAEVPSFGFDDSSPSVLGITYQSPRKLCALAEGFIIGAATHFGEKASLEQPVCMNRGDDHCLIQCGFTAG